MNRKLYKDLNTIEGIVTPIGWDRNDKINKLSIFTKDGDDVVLTDSRYFDNFKKMVNKWVRVQGIISKRGLVRTLVSIRRLKRLRKPRTNYRSDDLPEFSLLLPYSKA